MYQGVGSVEVMEQSREQELVDICFNIAMLLHDKKYKKHFDDMDREKLAEWVAHQLRGCGFDTFPCGASWGVLKR